ncbi:type II toxin-antitoxin system RelE/ParE family toxin [Variovorax sp. RT4R15]|uniref:type II toxin-antitoxin system RelE/ParE family toxin n=1 Tax=Variovorax sp. RT4R15 TaxID=3443737 RepID=UPI003F464A21
MTQIELAPEVLDDFVRFIEHLARFDGIDIPHRLSEVMQTIEILGHSPLIGRPVKAGKRELLIGRGSRAYVALYRYVVNIDTVFILALRSQREVGFKRKS